MNSTVRFSPRILLSRSSSLSGIWSQGLLCGGASTNLGLELLVDICVWHILEIDGYNLASVTYHVKGLRVLDLVLGVKGRIFATIVGKTMSGNDDWGAQDGVFKLYQRDKCNI